MNYPHYICFWDLLAYVIICHCDKWLPQHPWKQVDLHLLKCEQYIAMNCNILKIFSQNIRKNKLIINTILETQFSYNIIFIQEPPWSIIRSIPSFNNYEGEPLVGISHHPNWITFTRLPSNQSDYPRVTTFINIRISRLRFSLQNDILNYRDISYISCLNQSSTFFMINVYSDSSQSALKYLKDTEVDIPIWVPSEVRHLITDNRET